MIAQKNNNITVVANYPYGINATQLTWYTVINHSLDRGLYLIKQSAKAQNGCSGISLEMNIVGALSEQQTDRDPQASQPNTGNCCVRGVIGCNIYYSETPFQYIGKIYVDHTTNAYIEGFVTIIKIW